MIRQMAQRQAVNTPIQGSASDLIKLAMVKIHEELGTRKLNTRMLIQIHDELVFEVPQGELPGVTDLIRDKMENVLTLKVPVRVSIKKGKNWLDMEEVK
jgi:DNA polymerase-1